MARELSADTQPGEQHPQQVASYLSPGHSLAPSQSLKQPHFLPSSQRSRFWLPLC